MDYSPPTFDEPTREEPAAQEPAFAYPPKYQKKKPPAHLWLRSAISLALYLLLGYYIFHNFFILLVITAIVLFHELGHFAAMKYFRYSDLGIFFIPLLGAYVSGSKREISQRESAIILLAGPLPGIIIGIVLYWLDSMSGPGIYFYHISLTKIATLTVFLNLINLIPVYPLDGGQLLNRVFLDEEGWVSRIFVFFSIAFLCWLAWKWNMYILLILPAMLLLRMRADSKVTGVEKQLEEAGINADISYEELSDEDYWKIRNILIAEYPAFRDFELAPPYEYHAKEEKMMTMIRSLLHRHLIQDVSVAGKILLLLIWIAAFMAPWLLGMTQTGIFQHFF